MRQTDFMYCVYTVYLINFEKARIIKVYNVAETIFCWRKYDVTMIVKCFFDNTWVCFSRKNRIATIFTFCRYFVVVKILFILRLVWMYSIRHFYVNKNSIWYWEKIIWYKFSDIMAFFEILNILWYEWRCTFL